MLVNLENANLVLKHVQVVSVALTWNVYLALHLLM